MLKISFDPFPQLRTPRLLLRRVVPADAEAIYRLRSDPQNMKFVPRPLAASVDDAQDHIRAISEKVETGTGINWAMQFPERSALVGIIGLFRIEPENYRAEIGYMLLPEHQGKGLATEAVGAAVDYGFRQLGLHSIGAIIDPGNIASARVLEKSRFRKEAYFRENGYFQGRFLDTIVYGRLETD